MERALKQACFDPNKCTPKAPGEMQ